MFEAGYIKCEIIFIRKNNKNIQTILGYEQIFHEIIRHVTAIFFDLQQIKQEIGDGSTVCVLNLFPKVRTLPNLAALSLVKVEM